MAIHGAIKISHDDVFPAGAYLLGDVEAVEDLNLKQAGVDDYQQRDKATGLRLWAVRVVDVDPRGRRGQAEIVVRVASDVMPVPPAPVGAMPFRPVVFDGLTVTPWLDDRGFRARIAYSYRATGMRAPG